MDPVIFVHITLLCINIFKTCNLRQLCTLNLEFVVIPRCSINVSSISYNTHVEYSRVLRLERQSNQQSNETSFSRDECIS